MMATQHKDMIGGTFWIVGRDDAHCEQTLLPILRKLLTWEGKQAHRGAVEGRDFTILRKPLQVTLWNSSKIIFKSLESSTLRGHTIHGAFVDEVSETTLEQWQEIGNRTRAKETSFILGASNPTNRSSFLFTDLGFEFKELNGTNPENTWLDIWSTYDNKFNPKSYIERQEATYTSELQKQRAMSGLFIDMTGLVFDGFDRARHTRPH